MAQHGQYTGGRGLFLRGKRAVFTLTLKPRTYLVVREFLYSWKQFLLCIIAHADTEGMCV